jgi:hypothetical protein
MEESKTERKSERATDCEKPRSIESEIKIELESPLLNPIAEQDCNETHVYIGVFYRKCARKLRHEAHIMDLVRFPRLRSSLDVSSPRLPTSSSSSSLSTQSSSFVALSQISVFPHSASPSSASLSSPQSSSSSRNWSICMKSVVQLWIFNGVRLPIVSAFEEMRANVLWYREAAGKTKLSEASASLGGEASASLRGEASASLRGEASASLGGEASASVKSKVSASLGGGKTHSPRTCSTALKVEIMKWRYKYAWPHLDAFNIADMVPARAGKIDRKLLRSLPSLQMWTNGEERKEPLVHISVIVNLMAVCNLLADQLGDVHQIVALRKTIVMILYANRDIDPLLCAYLMPHALTRLAQSFLHCHALHLARATIGIGLNYVANLIDRERADLFSTVKNLPDSGTHRRDEFTSGFGTIAADIAMVPLLLVTFEIADIQELLKQRTSLERHPNTKVIPESRFFAEWISLATHVVAAQTIRRRTSGNVQLRRPCKDSKRQLTSPLLPTSNVTTASPISGNVASVSTGSHIFPIRNNNSRVPNNTDVEATDVGATDVETTCVGVTDVGVTDVEVTDVGVTDVEVTDVEVTAMLIADYSCPKINTSQKLRLYERCRSIMMNDDDDIDDLKRRRRRYVSQDIVTAHIVPRTFRFMPEFISRTRCAQFAVFADKLTEQVEWTQLKEGKAADRMHWILCHVLSAIGMCEETVWRLRSALEIALTLCDLRDEINNTAWYPPVMVCFAILHDCLAHLPHQHPADQRLSLLMRARRWCITRKLADHKFFAVCCWYEADLLQGECKGVTRNAEEPHSLRATAEVIIDGIPDKKTLVSIRARDRRRRS